MWIALVAAAHALDCTDIGTAVGVPVYEVAFGCTWTNDVDSCGDDEEDDAVTWTAPHSGEFTFDSVGSTFDTILAVRDGACTAEGTELACDDDSGGGDNAFFELAVTGGHAYTVILEDYNEGFGDCGGDFDLNIACSRRSFAGAITPGLAAASGNLTPGWSAISPSCAPSQGSEVTYTISVPRSSTYQIDTIGSSIDTVVSVHEADCGARELACDDDRGPGGAATLQLRLDPDSIVAVNVDSAAGESGDWVLNIIDCDGDDDGARNMACVGGDDCNDGDASIRPGVPEACDGEDTDCNGSALDEEVDADTDGYTACTGDCDDTRADVNPGVVEIPGNGMDDDCDGFADGDADTEGDTDTDTDTDTVDGGTTDVDLGCTGCRGNQAGLWLWLPGLALWRRRARSIRS